MKVQSSGNESTRLVVSEECLENCAAGPGCACDKHAGKSQGRMTDEEISELAKDQDISGCKSKFEPVQACCVCGFTSHYHMQFEVDISAKQVKGRDEQTSLIDKKVCGSCLLAINDLINALHSQGALQRIAAMENEKSKKLGVIAIPPGSNPFGKPS